MCENARICTSRDRSLFTYLGWIRGEYLNGGKREAEFSLGLLRSDTQTIKTNLERVGVTIPTLIDYSAVARRYQTIEPLIVLIDEKGMIRFKNTYGMSIVRL